jgi:hypothetical protein
LSATLSFQQSPCSTQPILICPLSGHPLNRTGFSQNMLVSSCLRCYDMTKAMDYNCAGESPKWRKNCRS